MKRRNLDTQGIGRRALTTVQTIVENAGHFLIPIDGDIDKGIDAYIRLRKKSKGFKIINKKKVAIEDYEETGNLIGIQVKGVSEIPPTRSRSYYITLKNKSSFGVNFQTKQNLDAKKKVWGNFIGPMILVFVNLNTSECWWADLKSEKSYLENGYTVSVLKDNKFNNQSFRGICKLGRELFNARKIPTINTDNYESFGLSLTNFKSSAENAYANLSNEEAEFYRPTINPVLGQIKYTQSGWRHITRLNRRKMRIINSILFLGVSRLICENVTKFTSVKKGVIRESDRFIKKAEFLTLRANVNFNFRQSAIVQVVLRRIKTFDKIHPEKRLDDQIFFHSVYEPYRKE
jgi:hypothetical protein